MTTSDQTAPTPGPTRRTRITLIVVAAVLAVVIAAVAVFFITGGADGDPVASPAPTASETPSTAPTAAPSTSPSPSPAPTDEPAPGPGADAIPDSCEDAFSPEYFELRTNYAYNPLNHESVARTPVLEEEQLEALRVSVPNLKCTWALAGEEGILSSINQVTAAQSAEVLSELQANGFDCVDHRGGTACSKGLFTNEENGATVAGEEHFVRDGVWISTNWLNIDIAGYNDDIIDTLWGA